MTRAFPSKCALVIGRVDLLEMWLFSGGLDDSEGACCTAEMTGKPNCCEPSDKPLGAVADGVGIGQGAGFARGTPVVDHG